MDPHLPPSLSAARVSTLVISPADTDSRAVPDTAPTAVVIGPPERPATLRADNTAEAIIIAGALCAAVLVSVLLWKLTSVLKGS